MLDGDEALVTHANDLGFDGVEEALNVGGELAGLTLLQEALDGVVEVGAQGEVVPRGLGNLHHALEVPATLAAEGA